MNLTATNTTSNGYLVAYAADSTKPNTTNLSFGANSTVSTLAQVKVSADGRIKIYSHTQADIVVDLEAWISAPRQDSQSYSSLDPLRIADTRYGTGVCTPSCGRMADYSTRSLQVTGHGGVPATGVSAVVVNITATAPSAAGWLKAYASGDPTPDGTSVVYEAGSDVANLAVVAVGSDGRIALSNSASLDVIIDVVGYYGENTDTWNYSYSPDGIRSTKTGPDTNTTYKWDRSSPLPMLLSETTASVGTTYYIYGPGGLPIEQINANGSVYFLHHDQIGSTRMITDLFGNAFATISYDAYGNEVAKSTTASSPFGFAGQYSDAESGYQYLRARYYDPTTGQFLTRDPIEALTRSAYGYVGGNPLNATDPSGLWCVTGVNKEASKRAGHQVCNGVKEAVSNAATTVGNNFSPAPGIPSVNMVATTYGMITSGGNCHQRGGRLECIGAASPISSTAFTMGDVVMNPGSTPLSDALFAHESRHSVQWGMFGGWPFLPAYLAARGIQGECNVFEGGAGFTSGDYDQCVHESACAPIGNAQPIVGVRLGG